MTRIDPIFIDSRENVSAEKAQMQNDLDRMRAMRSETEGIMAAYRLEITMWLDRLTMATEREKAFLKDTGDIADGELDVPYGFFQEAVKRLRKAQRTLLYMDREIESTVQTLADEEVWKPWRVQ